MNKKKKKKAQLKMFPYHSLETLVFFTFPKAIINLIIHPARKYPT